MPLAVREKLTMLMPPSLFYRRRIAEETRSGEPELAVLAEMVPRGGTAIDVGANLGFFAYALSNIADWVVAFEPNPDYAFFARWMEPRPQRADRLSLWVGQSGRHSQTRGRIGRARAGCHSVVRRRDVGPTLQATRTIPVVFVSVVDPVGAGFVDSMAQPGGNATGFVMLEYSMTAKYLELLKEIAPFVTRVAVFGTRPFRPEPANSARYSPLRRRSGWM